MDEKKWPTDSLPPPRIPERVWRRSDAASPPEPGDALAEFLDVRPRLFGIAYRMLGSVADAEDLVQDAWVRWQGCDRAAVREPAAFLATTVTHLAINLLQSAHVRRERYVGPWLPEPIDTGADPELAAEDDDTIRLGVLLLLERLSPPERAAYVLREAFGYPFAQIAEILGTTEVNARQIASRARAHVAAERHEIVPLETQRRFLTAFLGAARTGDVATLESLLADDVISRSDSGGDTHTARHPISGRERVASFVAAIMGWFLPDIDIRWVEVNRQIAAVFGYRGKEIGMVSIAVDPAGIRRVYWIMTPRKLGAVVATGSG